RALMILSSSLIKYKQLSPHEQEVKREFLARDNKGSLRNVLPAVGFPESLGKSLIDRKFEELKTSKLGKALIKVNSVFDRAFYFMVKETELTKKPIDELLAAAESLSEPDDVRLYLETLLYKIEEASTEKSF
ncbi:MAG: hypothetical protein HQL31_11895, partial [Planctomycetes bacterium]|nr:hypothetical protein [Planctomycetota bacterium]